MLKRAVEVKVLMVDAFKDSMNHCSSEAGEIILHLVRYNALPVVFERTEDIGFQIGNGEMVWQRIGVLL